MDYLPVTGTFIDEMTHDIPAQNWGLDEWTTEFDTFVRAGIDTVIIIRTGYGEKLACPSSVLSERVQTLPVHADLVDLFLTLAADRGISVYVGLYDSGYYWHRNDWTVEVDINKEYLHELHTRYGSRPGFSGWYLPHETTDSGSRIIDINTTLAAEIKEISSLPILVSPFFAGRAGTGSGVRTQPRTPEEHARVWEEMFERYAGLVDYCAFQDGTADLLALSELTAATAEVANRHGIRLWSNFESFDRDVHIKFPPIDWRKMAHKLDVVQPHVEKIITFEFSHFMSPNSMWQSARNLYRRYWDHLAARTS